MTNEAARVARRKGKTERKRSRRILQGNYNGTPPTKED